MCTRTSWAGKVSVWARAERKALWAAASSPVPRASRPRAESSAHEYVVLAVVVAVVVVAVVVVVVAVAVVAAVVEAVAARSGADAARGAGSGVRAGAGSRAGGAGSLATGSSPFSPGKLKLVGNRTPSGRMLNPLQPGPARMAVRARGQKCRRIVCFIL